MPLHRLLLTLRLGVRNLARAKLRSSLTVLGVILGVGSVIVMLAVGEGARAEAIAQIQSLGASNIILRSMKPLVNNAANPDGGPARYGLTLEDLDRLLSTVPTVISAAPIREHRMEARHLDRDLEARIIGVTPAYQDLSGLVLEQGRFLSDLDAEKLSTVAVLAHETAEALFPFHDPIGQCVRLGEDHYYEVVGVMQSRAPFAGIEGTLPPQDYNRDVYLPFATDRARFGEVISDQNAGTKASERVEISQITVTTSGTEYVKDTAEVIASLIRSSRKTNDTEIIVPLELIEKVEQTKRVFTLVIGSIAAISLLVGGIGIMNIMLATVTERTREIGIRRALGAKRRHIIAQFLMETVVLSTAGGIVGLALGVSLSFLLTHFLSMHTIIEPWALFLALGISVAVGLVFGTYPARRAAFMNPLDALRHE